MNENVVTKAWLSPKEGTVTWESEGTEGGRYHSRILHVPTNSSGLTIGRGYDMCKKSSGTIVNDLVDAGVDEATAKKISKASGLTGDAARKFIIDNKLEKFEISQETQLLLFKKTYASLSEDVKRICEKPLVIGKYGSTNLENIHIAIKEIVVDLRYRGDYTPEHRKRIQKFISQNDLESFSRDLSNKENWKNVPQDRFNRRKVYLEDALKEKRRIDSLRGPQSR